MSTTGARRRNVMRDRPAIVWLAAAVIIALVHRQVAESTWLMVHLVLLGALTHSAMVWSAHFTRSLLKTPDSDREQRNATRRVSLLAVGVLVVLIGVPTAHWHVVVTGAVLVSLAVLWHAAWLVRSLRRALPGRFRVTVRYYVLAALCLPVGAGFGASLAWGPDDIWHGRLLVAHTMTMLLGWVGLTITGTLVTFWPTVLRTRMDERAESLARAALPGLVVGLAVLVTGGLSGLRSVALAGLAVYVLSVFWWGRALLGPARRQPPRHFAAASIGAALLWLPVALGATGYVLATVPADTDLADAWWPIVAIWVVGVASQIVPGALSYLMPVMLGGGPSAVRAAGEPFDRWASARLTVINLGLVVWLLPAPSWVRVTVSSLVLLFLASFIPLLFIAVRSSLAARATSAAPKGPVAPGATGTPAAPAHPAAPAAATEQVRRSPRERGARPVGSALSGSGVIAGVAAVAIAVTLGVAVDPGAAGLVTGSPGSSGASSGTASVTPTGVTVRVAVEAHDMRFVPARVEAAAGDRVIITLVNKDPRTRHDLMVGNQRTPRLSEGQSAELDLGVVAGSEQGWCTVVGHRQMGMVLDIVVTGGAATSAASDASGGTGHPAGHSGTSAASQTRTAASADAVVADPVSATLPPLESGTVHRITLTVKEVTLEVAPGVWQKRWTYGGRTPGPTLHGRVGDVFEVTLVNDGSIGHSVDFHAGALAPDQPMRTIPPGESLVYRFTAQRAGIWMYHCSSMPMSMHIAAGMHGAVVIEPPGLPEVDRQYVLVQSEVHVSDGTGTTAASAAEVDGDSVVADTPDFVVFNGIANQYDQHPLSAKVGERVRIWVLDAGPNRSSSFHVVGGQFDTVYLEGAYRLSRGKGPFGETSGGAQSLGLLAAQGGFVELTMPEAGHYPIVSHIMNDAELGAHGVLEVTP